MERASAREGRGAYRGVASARKIKTRCQKEKRLEGRVRWLCGRDPRWGGAGRWWRGRRGRGEARRSWLELIKKRKRNGSGVGVRAIHVFGLRVA